MNKTELSYTPGPWRVGSKHEDESFAIHAPRASVIHATPFVSSLREASANARLIAAAPELLEALERTTTNIGLVHVDELMASNRCAFGVDTCPCPLAKQWRNNMALINKIKGK